MTNLQFIKKTLKIKLEPNETPNNIPQKRSRLSISHNRKQRRNELTSQAPSPKDDESVIYKKTVIPIDKESNVSVKKKAPKDSQKENIVIADKRENNATVASNAESKSTSKESNEISWQS